MVLLSNFRIIVPALLLLLLLLAPVAGKAQEQPRLRLATPEEMKAELAAVPCKNEERLQAAQALFENAGASGAVINLAQFKTVKNLVVRKQGASAETIIVGAHYDKVSEGCGAIDNWTGIVSLVQLYRALKDVPFQKTVLFVAFGKEEKGLVGSHAMVNAMSKEEAAQVCAMVNLDSLGMSLTQVADNMSSRKLEELAASLAREMKMPFAHASIKGADADSSPFIGKKIPALTIHGLSADWPNILHSRKDQPDKVDSGGVYLGYRLALNLIAHINDANCQAYR